MAKAKSNARSARGKTLVAIKGLDVFEFKNRLAAKVFMLEATARGFEAAITVSKVK